MFIGFGLYLQSVDTEARDWRWQLSCCTRFCLIHFTRSINTATPGCPHINDSAWGRMQALIKVETPEQYYQLVDLLISMYYSKHVQNTF